MHSILSWNLLVFCPTPFHYIRFFLVCCFFPFPFFMKGSASVFFFLFVFLWSTTWVCNSHTNLNDQKSSREKLAFPAPQKNGEIHIFKATLTPVFRWCSDRQPRNSEQLPPQWIPHDGWCQLFSPQSFCLYMLAIFLFRRTADVWRKGEKKKPSVFSHVWVCREGGERRINAGNNRNGVKCLNSEKLLSCWAWLTV